MEQITRAVENDPMMKSLENDVTIIIKWVRDGHTATSRGVINRNHRTTVRQNMRLIHEYKYADGKYRRVP